MIRKTIEKWILKTVWWAIRTAYFFLVSLAASLMAILLGETGICRSWFEFLVAGFIGGIATTQFSLSLFPAEWAGEPLLALLVFGISEAIWLHAAIATYHGFQDYEPPEDVNLDEMV